jgi:hypothetical protein
LINSEQNYLAKIPFFIGFCTKKTATLGVAASIYILKNKLGIGKLATCVGRVAISHSFAL